MKLDRFLKPVPIILIFTCSLFFIFVLILGYSFSTLPDINLLKTCIKKTSFKKVRLCEKSNGYLKLEQISDYLENAILISEDAGFYYHNGFDFFEISESFKRNIEDFRLVRGGSTISQQLVKNVFLSGDKTLTRKIKEAILTYQLEKNFTKEFIFEKYLNVVQFGEKVFGAESAAEYYFNKSAQELGILESAFLAMLLPNPVKYSKSYKEKKLTNFANSRMKDIIYKLYFYKKISEFEYEISKAELSHFFGQSKDELYDFPDEFPEDYNSDDLIEDDDFSTFDNKMEKEK